MSRLFVTATGTELGKTFTSAALLNGARAAGATVKGLKPVASGIDDGNLADSDPAVLLRAQGEAVDWVQVERICPWHFAAALSPDMAAAREGRRVPFDELVGFCRRGLAGSEEFVLVEGVGGVMAPIDERHTVLDWVKALEIPALLVAGTYLGTISHTLTALATLAGRGVPVEALVLSESEASPVPPAETAAAIQRFAPGLAILHAPRLAGPDAWRGLADLYPALKRAGRSAGGAPAPR
ncbi:ATP-dependent dethiobiotin synthetase BioD [Aliidongia dinghuensis]|uniref:ATP-dependent dethiobiotin synthetase BioD n=1 Tax=Aliidongia dinghuensis TaxID=1867774 RepID=A0A8J2YU32_9PROT|nr:dethiobiotin synthase [Aliidongia dinghuensis]GGF21206.1 ATP-dependent dethiobiotin synthetase BioD [Aliidongia dinghuensis]